jgi:hypothetical protein
MSNHETVVLRESNYDTGMTYDEAEAQVRAAGYDAPSDFGYDPADCDWFGPDYARSAYESDWDEDTLYWIYKL